MYSFYLDKVLLPVTPPKLTTKVNNKNKTMTLINDGEINILKEPGLKEITFEALFPQVEYPFAVYKGKRFRDAEYFLKKLEKLKSNKKKFRFIVTRETKNGEFFDTNMKVSLEDYSILEDANNGIDITVSIKLKQYKDYSTKTVVIAEPVQSVVATTTATTTAQTVSPPVATRPVETAPTPQTYTVVGGDCLWNICKQYLGDGSKCYEIATINGISNPNLIYPGQVITLG